MVSQSQAQRLTSLLLVEERLLEADFFVRRLGRANPHVAGYFLNAFLSAARSVTFLLQKEMAHVPCFPAWWESQRATLGQDKVARFFLELRNFSQKAGRVSLVGTRSGRTRGSAWTYRFVGVSTPVPGDLQGIDATDACSAHVAKLARVVLSCMDAFPHHTCPSMALSPAGVAALGLNVGELFRTLGLPYVEGDDELATYVLRREVDAVDVAAIRRLASPRRRRLVLEVDSFDAQLLGRLEARLRGPTSSLDRYEFVAAVMSISLPTDEGEPPA